MKHHLPMDARQEDIPKFATDGNRQVTVRQEIDLQEFDDRSI